MNSSKLLVISLLLASGHALADAPPNVCTTLATDKTGSRNAGCLSDATEVSTRGFAR